MAIGREIACCVQHCNNASGFSWHQWGKNDLPLQDIVSRKLTIPLREKKIKALYLVSFLQISLRWIKNFKIIKLLRENIGKYIHDLYECRD